MRLTLSLELFPRLCRYCPTCCLVHTCTWVACANTPCLHPDTVDTPLEVLNVAFVAGKSACVKGINTHTVDNVVSVNQEVLAGRTTAGVTTSRVAGDPPHGQRGQNTILVETLNTAGVPNVGRCQHPVDGSLGCSMSPRVPGMFLPALYFLGRVSITIHWLRPYNVERPLGSMHVHGVEKNGMCHTP